MKKPWNQCGQCGCWLDPGEGRICSDCREKMDRIQKIAERNRNAVRLDGQQYALKTEGMSI